MFNIALGGLMRRPFPTMATALSLATSALCLPFDACATDKPVRMTPAEIPWPKPSSTKQPGSAMEDGVQSVVIFGDASQKALYSIMFKVEPNSSIAAHSHPDDRSCFVMEGVWYFGYGDRYLESALRALPPGSHYTEPANRNHFAGTQSEGAVVECTSIGPTGTTLVERNKK